MEYKNSVHPTKDQMEGFLEGDTDTPIAMVNLLKFKEKAESLVLSSWALACLDSSPVHHFLAA